MSLITRCSACGTMFKVVADQLKISQGWVRCGHCSEVFDAAANLQPYAPQPPASFTEGPVSTLEEVRPDMQEDTGRAGSVAAMLVAPSAEPDAAWSNPVAAPEAAPAAERDGGSVHRCTPPHRRQVRKNNVSAGEPFRQILSITFWFRGSVLRKFRGHL